MPQTDGEFGSHPDSHSKYVVGKLSGKCYKPLTVKLRFHEFGAVWGALEPLGLKFWLSRGAVYRTKHELRVQLQAGGRHRYRNRIIYWTAL